MANHRTVQWCPNAKSWHPGKLIVRETVKTIVSTGQSVGSEFEYFRNLWQCSECGTESVSFKPKSLGGPGVWEQNFELARIDRETREPPADARNRDPEVVDPVKGLLPRKRLTISE